MPADSLSPRGRTTLQRRAWYIYPVPTSEALTGFKLTLIVAYLWRSAMDGVTRPSTVHVYTAYTEKHQLLMALAGDMWSPGNRRNLSYSIGFSHFPQPFYGIGPRSSASAGGLFTPSTIALDLDAAQEVFPNGRLQVGLHAVHATIHDRHAGGLLEPDTLEGGSSYAVIAPEIGLMLDSRDRLYDPRTGALLQARVRASLAPLGASSNFQAFLLDGRVYHRIRDGSVLAAQLAFEGVRGRVPFEELPQLGAASLRGYVFGRWRDRTLLRGQVEWRQHLFWRLGAVAFGAAGALARDLERLGDSPVRRSYGAGLRFNLSTKENANFSMDYARGPGRASELLFRFAEAF